MNPGQLDRRVVIEQRTLSRDAMGGRVETWATFATVWAAFRPSTNSEPITSDTERRQMRAQFVIRYRSLNSMEHRITYQGQVWNINSSSETGGRDNYLTLECVANDNVS